MGGEGSAWRAAPAAGQLARASLASAHALFECLSTTAFYAKDNALRFVMVNTAMADLCGASSRAGMIGKTARDVFPEIVRLRHETSDRQAMRTVSPLRDQLELFIAHDGARRWLLSTRWPVCDELGAVVGVAAVARMLDAERRNHAGYGKLASALEHLQLNFTMPCDIGDLARRVGLSTSQLKRDFIAVFGMPPRRYLTKIRLEAALEKLTSNAPIVEVAHACGYSDQAAFTRRFRSLVGMSPSDYRRSLASRGRAAFAHVAA